MKSFPAAGQPFHGLPNIAISSSSQSTWLLSAPGKHGCCLLDDRIKVKGRYLRFQLSIEEYHVRASVNSRSLIVRCFLL